MMPPAALPPMEQLATEYRSGQSYRMLGEKYGYSASTMRNRLHAWAVDRGEWPLIEPTQKRGQNRDVVPVDLARSEIAATCRQYRISQVALAKVAKVSPNLLHKISGGHVDHILRTTQGKILEACSKLYAGEVVLPPTTTWLPMHARDRCPNNHPYTGKRDAKTGRRHCSVCRAYKDARRSEKQRALKAS